MKLTQIQIDSIVNLLVEKQQKINNVALEKYKKSSVVAKKVDYLKGQIKLIPKDVLNYLHENRYSSNVGSIKNIEAYALKGFKYPQNKNQSQLRNEVIIATIDCKDMQELKRKFNL